MEQKENIARQRTLRYLERQFKNRRSIAFFNGWMLIIASPILFIIGVGQAMKKPEPGWDILAGLLICAIFLVPGILSVRASRRMKRPVWHKNLLGREPGNAGSQQPQNQPSPDESATDG